jgi:hypothetical protein|tara:strand:- start:1785 stop:4847 length:3063 start_codon:yes stop_codon:yes gene_type:complete
MQFEQQQYDPRVNVDIGQPLTAPDIEQQISQVAQQQARLDQEFLNQMGSNQKMDTQNLQTTIKNEQAALQKSQQQLQQLGQFSDMLMKQAEGFAQDYMKDRAAEGQAARLDMDPSTFSPETTAEYNRQMAELKLAGMDADEAAAQALRATQNYEVAQRYQSLGQYQRVGFAKQHMNEKKIEWPSLLQDRMSTDNTTQITRPDGTTFTPQQAMQTGNSAERAAAASVLYKDFIKDAGMAQSNPLFVEQYFAGGKGGARQQTQKFLADANKASNINKSQKNYYNAQQEFAIDGDFGELWRGSGLLLDANGKPLSFDDRWKKVTSTVEAAINSGQITDVDAFLANNTDPLTGRPLSERRGFANKVKLAYDNYLSTNYTRINNNGKRTYQDLESQYLQFAREQGDGLTYGEYQEMQKQLQTIQGGSGESKALAALYSQTEQVENRESNKKILMQAAVDGTLTPKMVEEAGFADGSAEGIDLMNKARAIQNTSSSTNNFQESKTTIDQAIKQVANLAPDAPLSLTTLAVRNKLLSEVKKKTAELVAGGVDPKQAENIALLELTPQWQARGFKKGGLEGDLAPGQMNNFPTTVSKATAGAQLISANIAEAKAKLDKDLAEKGARAYDTPDTYVSPDRLQANGNTYYEADGVTINKNWKPDPYVAQLAANDPNETAFTITNKLRVANGLDPLRPPESMFLEGGRDETVDTATAQLLQQTTRTLEKARSSNETIRAGVSGGPIATTKLRVPKELEPVFTQVSTNTGMRMELVQAIAQTESGMDPTAISPANADGSRDYGLFQINNQAHPDYKYAAGDVQANAAIAERQLNLTAARADELGVLPQYREKFILAGYNQGQNSIPVINGVPQFNAQHKAYISKVYKQMGGLGRTEVLRDASTMRKPFASAVDPVYVTGNIGPTSTGEHLDVKRVDKGFFEYNALDEYVEVEDKDLGRVPLSRVPETGDFRSHTSRGSHGRDYGTYSGSKLFLKNGAKPVPELSGPTEHGYYQVIELPDGTRYSFLHGSAPQ